MLTREELDKEINKAIDGMIKRVVLMVVGAAVVIWVLCALVKELVE